MKKFYIIVALLLSISALGCELHGHVVGNASPNGDVGKITFFFDHASGWLQRDVTGLKDGDSVLVQFDVYLPDGGSWNDQLRATFQSAVKAGKVGDGDLIPVVLFTEVPQHANVQHVNVSLKNQGVGVYWFAVASSAVQPFKPDAGYTFLGTVPAHLEQMLNDQPGFWLRTVGKCPHPVEITAVKTSNGGIWKVRLSESIELGAKQNAPLKSALDNGGEVAAEINQTQTDELTVTVQALGTVPLPPATLPFGPGLGLAGTFGSDAGCEVAAGSLTLSKSLRQAAAPINYGALALKFAPSLFGEQSKPAAK